jgi:hypothetical protein
MKPEHIPPDLICHSLQGCGDVYLINPGMSIVDEHRPSFLTAPEPSSFILAIVTISIFLLQRSNNGNNGD